MNIKNIAVCFGVLVASVVFIASSSDVRAISDDFVTTTLVGGDTVPPTVPAPFSVTPVSSTQINLTWGASTDNFILSGYHVWRDNVQIATTTSTSYADTGLTPTTTYSYYVTAYDSFFNESASSTEIATTTLDVPSPLSTSTPSSTSGTRLWDFDSEIVSLVVLPRKNSAIIRYETKSYIKSVVKWGETTSYELGSVAEHAFTKFHETTIYDLTPDTKYYFTIEGVNRYNKYGVLHTGEFMTLPLEDTFPPENVTNLSAVLVDGNVELSWTNPPDLDFDKVRVVQNENFYPSDIADGWVIYEGDGTTATDKEINPYDLWLYYTVFAYDELGNISSGAVVSIYVGSREDYVDSGDEPDPAKNEISLKYGDIQFIQDGELLIPDEDLNVYLDGSKKLTIAIPYEVLPEHLKTILVTLSEGVDTEKEFKFLLRINKNKTAYTSTIAPFGRNGLFPIRVSVFDFKTSQIGYTEGTLISEISYVRNVEYENSIIYKLINILTNSFFWMIVILLLILMFVSRRLIQEER